MVRKEAVGEWLQSVVKETVEKEIAEIDMDDKIILSLLTGMYTHGVQILFDFRWILNTHSAYINLLIRNLLIIIILMFKSTKIGRSMSDC